MIKDKDIYFILVDGYASEYPDINYTVVKEEAKKAKSVILRNNSKAEEAKRTPTLEQLTVGLDAKMLAALEKDKEYYNMEMWLKGIEINLRKYNQAKGTESFKAPQSVEYKRPVNPTQDQPQQPQQSEQHQNYQQQQGLLDYLTRIVKKVHPDKNAHKFAKSIYDTILENNRKFRPSPELAAILLDTVDYKVSAAITTSKEHKSGDFFSMVKREVRRINNPGQRSNSLSEKELNSAFKALKETSASTKERFGKPRSRKR